MLGLLVGVQCFAYKNRYPHLVEVVSLSLSTPAHLCYTYMCSALIAVVQVGVLLCDEDADIRYE